MPRVILLPGSVLPAESAYRDLVTALGPEVDAVAKDLELYATPEPPEVYDLEPEVAGVLREADDRGWERFHLVGYSGGGAACSRWPPPGRSGSRAWRSSSLRGRKLGPEPTGADAGGRVQPARRHARRRVHAGLHAASTGAWRSASRAAAGRPAALDGEPASGHPRVSELLRRGRHRPRRPSPLRSPRLLRARWPEQPRLLRGERRGGWTTCSRTSSLRCSRSATTSTRPTASSPSAWPPRSGGSGGAEAPPHQPPIPPRD